MAARSATLDCSDPGVMDLIFNDEALKIWEYIRSRDKAITIQAIQSDLGSGVRQVQNNIDQLLEHGLLQKIRARKPRTTTGYTATAEQIIIAFDEHDAEITSRLAAHSDKVHSEHRTIVDQYADLDFHTKAGIRFRHSSTHCFTPDELAELRRRVHAVITFLNMPRNRKSKSNDSEATSPEDARYCNQAVSIILDPLAGDLLPSPTIITTRRSKVDWWDDSRPDAAGLNALTPREREIALGIADGLSRTQIADQLGISVNTVSTLIRRAYKKIGVSSQAELAARLAGYDRPVPGGD